jgi:hypothetical protein
VHRARGITSTYLHTHHTTPHHITSHHIPLAPRNHRTSNGLAASINPHHPRAMRGWFPRGTGPVSSRIWFDRERHTTAPQQSAPARRETICRGALWTRWHWREVAPILHVTGTASSPSPPRASPRPHHSGLRFRGPAGGSPPPRLLVLPARRGWEVQR